MFFLSFNTTKIYLSISASSLAFREPVTTAAAGVGALVASSSALNDMEELPTGPK